MSASQRVDKWLWFSRIVKSRTLAAELVTDGKVRLNRMRVEKASKEVVPGDVLTLTMGRVRIIKVVGIGHRRGPAPEAQALYEDLSPPVERVRDPGAAIEPMRDAGAGRPTKRDRRSMDRLRGTRAPLDGAHAGGEDDASDDVDDFSSDDDHDHHDDFGCDDDHDLQK